MELNCVINNLAGKRVEYQNGDLIIGDAGTSVLKHQRISKDEMKELAKGYKGANRIHKPMSLLFWSDCKNKKTQNWTLDYYYCK